MKQYVFIIAIYVLSGILTYYIGYRNGKEHQIELAKDPDKQEHRWTTLVVVAIVFAMICIAIYVSLDIWGEKSSTRLILSILTVLILSGAMGGLIGNYYRKQRDEPGTTRRDLLVSILLGIGASLLVPVFLHILTSNLLEEIQSKPEKAFILVGFCLAAAISGETFIAEIIDTISDMARDRQKKRIEARQAAALEKGETPAIQEAQKEMLEGV